MEKKIGIIIPVRNCLDLTVAAVASVKTKYPYQVYVVDDRSDPPMKLWLEARRDIIALVDPPGSTGLAFNWNLGISYASQDSCSHILVANNDILLHPETIDSLVERMDRGDVVMATGVNVASRCPVPEDIFQLEVGEESESEHPDFSCFMITKKTIDRVGWFDQNFVGAYVEDCDYHARIALLGERAVSYNRAPYFHYASQTLRQNVDIAPEIQQRHARNNEYFCRKWGRLPVGDVEAMRQLYFNTPYNDPQRSAKEWE
jgi:GT2 family glycosyltransferase